MSVVGSSDAVRLCVHNLGIPIAKDALVSLFDPLVRSPSEDATLPGATTSLGLGLFIVKEVVDAHHGEITVTSTLDQGTTFTVVLPKA